MIEPSALKSLFSAAEFAERVLGDIYNQELAAGNDDHEEIQAMRKCLDKLNDSIDRVRNGV